MQTVVAEHSETFVKHFKGLFALRDAMSTKRNWKTEVRVYWGKTNTGKSFSAHQECPCAYKLPKGVGNGVVWFDGYDGDDHIIIDDFYGWIPMAFMLELLDSYPMRLPVKGSFTQMKARRIIITSNTHPSSWYQKHFLAMPEHEDAFMRRLDIIKHFEGKDYKDRIITIEKGADSCAMDPDLEQPVTGMVDVHADDPDCACSMCESKRRSCAPLPTIAEEDDVWNVGGGVQCHFCDDDIRHCKNSCEVDPHGMSPTSLQVLLRLNRRDFAWLKPPLREEKDAFLEDFECHEEEELEYAVNKLAEIKSKRGAFYAPANDDCSRNSHILAIDRKQDYIVL